MMGGPRLFTIGNMQNMQNSMIPIQAGLSMLGHNALSMSMEGGGGIKVPLKVPEVPSPISFHHEAGGPKITVIDDSIPQDLTTKKTPPLRSPPLRSPTSAKSPSSVLREVNGATTPNNNFNNSRFYNNFHKEEHMEDIKAHFNSSAASPTHSMEDDLGTMREMKEEIPPAHILDDKKAVEKADKAMDFTCNGTSHKNCDHAEKLRALRKNIVRMLSVLTPDLGVENTLDYDSDQVDELLHEVIYSNIEEEAVKT